jgi:hypothetical protein
MSERSGPPYGACVLHNKANELLVQYKQFKPSVQEGTQQAHPLGSYPANLAYVIRPGVSFV